MAEGDTNDGTSFQQPATTGLPEALKEVLNDFLGNPQLSQAIGNGIEPFISQFTRNNIQTPGGMLSGAPNMLFGGQPQNPGAYAYAQFNNMSTVSTMQRTQSAVNEALRQQNEDFHKFLGAGRGAALADSNNMFNMTNLASRLQFGLHGGRDLMVGLEEAARFQGMGQTVGGLSPGSFKVQQGINRQAGALNEAITQDYFQNMNQYGGLDGKEIGQVVAEMSRTGQIGGGLSLDQSKNAVREMTKTVTALKQFFKGDVADLIDQVNGLTGSNFQATYGSGASAMINNLSSTGFVTGHTRNQMLTLANASGQMSQRMGVDPISGLAVAENTAQFLQASRMAGGPERFVNEERYRNSILKMQTRSSNSFQSRLITGAAAYIAEDLNVDGTFGEGNEAAALSFARELEDMGLAATPDKIVEMLAAKGINTTTEDVLNMGYTDAALTLKAKGAGTGAQFKRNIASINRSRRSTLRNILDTTAGIDDDTRKRIMQNMNGQTMTMENIDSFLAAELGGDSVTRSNIVAEAGRIFNANSNSVRGINRQEEDRLLRTGARDDIQRLLEEQGAFRTGLVEATRDSGSIGGLRAISELVRDPTKSKNFQTLFDTLTGGSNRNIDLSSKKMRRVLGMNAAGILDKEDIASMSDAEAMGVTRAFQALSGQIEGKNISEEAQQEAYNIFYGDEYKSVTDRRQAAARFLQEYDPDTMSQYKHSKLTDTIAKELYGEDFHKKITGKGDKATAARELQSKRRSDADKRATMIEQLDSVATAKLAGEDQENFHKTRKLYREAIMGSEGKVGQIAKEFWEDEERTGVMGKGAFDKVMQREKAIGKGGTDATNGLLSSILGLLEGFNPPESGGKQ